MTKLINEEFKKEILRDLDKIRETLTGKSEETILPISTEGWRYCELCRKGYKADIPKNNMENKKNENPLEWTCKACNSSWFGYDFCSGCGAPRPKPEEKRKLFDVMLRAYKDAPEVTSDGSFPFVAQEVMADLEKRIDEFDIEADYCVRRVAQPKLSTALKAFIRKEWLGEGEK